jgi:cellobiose transport system permease protein
MSAPAVPAAQRQPAPEGQGSPRPGRAAWRSRLTRLDMTVTPYLLIAPFFVLFGAFGLFPLLYNLVVSFRTWRLDDPAADGWAGLENYRTMLGDAEFWRAMRNTVGLFVFSSGPQLLVALLLAAVLNRRLRFQTLLRMGVLLPYITPIAASTLVFGAVFAKETGLVNSGLTELGLGTVDFKADVWSSWLAVVTMIDWRWTGYWALIFLAAMQSVPRDLYEAATVDGAKVWTQFWRITVPLIRPSIVFAVVVSTIGGLQLFTEPLLFDDTPQNASGGSAGQFQTIGMYVYKTAWKDFDLGSAAAMSTGLFVVIVVVSAINAWLTHRIGGR